MECERSIITTTLLRLDYLVHSLDNCADDTSTETGLSCWIQNLSRKGSKNPSLFFFEATGQSLLPSLAILILPVMTSYSLGMERIGEEWCLDFYENISIMPGPNEVF